MSKIRIPLSANNSLRPTRGKARVLPDPCGGPFAQVQDLSGKGG